MNTNPKSHPGADDGGDREIVGMRLVNAPQAKVFQAFVDPSILAKWWGPDGFTNTFHEFDLRPGGKWAFVMHGPDGTDYKNESNFVEVAPPDRIVFDHITGHFFNMTLSFEPRGGQTLFGFRMRFNSAEERDRVAVFAIDANEQNFDRLERAVAEIG